MGISWDQVSTKSALSRHQVVKILRLCEKEQPITVLMNKFEWNNRSKFKEKFINPLMDMELLSMTIPEKPQSSKQKYIISEKGKELLQSGSK